MAETVHLAIPADGEDYRFYAEVAAESARRGSSLPVEVHFIDWTTVDRARLERLGRWHGSAIAFSRLFLAELFPDLDWVISCDADVLFRGDVADLWRLRDDSVSILAQRDRPLPPHPYTEAHIDWYRAHGLAFADPASYFCDGVCLCNLARWRRLGLQERFVALAERFRDWPSPDQMILNYVLQDDKRLLSRQWGFFSGDENADVDWSRSGAAHFVEDPPWNRHKVTHLMTDLVVEWRRLANELGGRYALSGWRRWAYLLLNRNPWILRLHPKLWLHLRSAKASVRAVRPRPPVPETSKRK